MSRLGGHLNHLLGRQVRVRFFTGSPYVEGRVVGILYDPSLVIQRDDGSQEAVSASLPREVVERRRPIPSSEKAR